MMMSLFLPDTLQTYKNLYFLNLTAYYSGIWGHILLFIGHIASEREKTCYGSSNNDVINLKAMIERYTFSSNL